MTGPVVGDDGVARCPWGAGTEVYRDYHDTEWGGRSAARRRTSSG